MRRPATRITTALALWVMVGTTHAGFIVVDLGVLPGGSGSRGNGLNADGAVVGSGTIGIATQRAVLGGGGAPSDLGLLTGGGFSAGYGVNTAGLVAGDADTRIDGVLRTRAFRSQGAGALLDMGTLGSDVASAARGINSSGHIAGWSTSAGGRTQAVIGFAPNAMTAVGNLGGTSSQAFAINDADAVVGHATTDTGATRAFITLGAETRNLGTLLGSDGSSARGVNNRNDVVGFTTGAVARGFLAPGGQGPLVDLGLLPFSTWSRAYGVNDQRLAVGESGGDAADVSAFLWTPDEGMFDLNLLIASTSPWRLISATGINNNAQISGYGLLDGQIRGFRLDPIPDQPITQPPGAPEPGSLVLLAAGAALLAARRALSRRTLERPATPG